MWYLRQLAKDLDHSCARNMINESFVGENYGSDLIKDYDYFSNNYYRSELSNSSTLVRLIADLDSPDISPSSKGLSDNTTLNKLIINDINHSNALNAQEWASRVNTQFQDNLKSRVGANHISREDSIFLI